MVESAFEHVAFGPAQGAEVGHHDGVGAVLGGVELVGAGFDAHAVGVAVHASAGAIVVADEVRSVKGEFCRELPLRHWGNLRIERQKHYI